MIHQDSYDRQMNKRVARLLMIALLVAICSAGVSYMPFDLYTHGNGARAIALIGKLYSQSKIGISTFVWYGIMLIPLWLAWIKLEKHHFFYRAVWRMTLLALFLPPGIFINPPPSFGAAFTDPTHWSTQAEILFLPAIICVVQYTLYLIFHFEDLYPIAATITLSVLPIVVVWFVALVIISVYKKRESFET
jgi:hypothetical protein